MKDLILIIDMQNAYEKGMPWECHSIERTKKNVMRLLETGVDAVFTAFLPPSDPDGAWKEYNAVNREINENEWANEIIPELSPYLSRHRVFNKSRYSSLSAPGLRELVGSYDRVVVTGVVAECCVLATVFSLVDAGIPFVYLQDAVSGLCRESENEAKSIVSYMIPVHGSIMNVDEYICSISDDLGVNKL